VPSGSQGRAAQRDDVRLVDGCLTAPAAPGGVAKNVDKAVMAEQLQALESGAGAGVLWDTAYAGVTSAASHGRPDCPRRRRMVAAKVASLRVSDGVGFEPLRRGRPGGPAERLCVTSQMEQAQQHTLVHTGSCIHAAALENSCGSLLSCQPWAPSTVGHDLAQAHAQTTKLAQVPSRQS
jgi:hypothetical protein